MVSVLFLLTVFAGVRMVCLEPFYCPSCAEAKISVELIFEDGVDRCWQSSAICGPLDWSSRQNSVLSVREHLRVCKAIPKVIGFVGEGGYWRSVRMRSHAIEQLMTQHGVGRFRACIYKTVVWRLKIKNSSVQSADMRSCVVGMSHACLSNPCPDVILRVNWSWLTNAYCSFVYEMG